MGAFDNLEIVKQRGFFRRILQDFQYDCAFGRLFFQFLAKILQSVLRALGTNFYIGALVADGSRDAERLCRAADEGAKSDALHDAEDFESTGLQNFFCHADAAFP